MFPIGFDYFYTEGGVLIRGADTFEVYRLNELLYELRLVEKIALDNNVLFYPSNTIRRHTCVD